MIFRSAIYQIVKKKRNHKFTTTHILPREWIIQISLFNHRIVQIKSNQIKQKKNRKEKNDFAALKWWRVLDNMTDKFGSQINELWANFGSDFTYPGNLPSYVEDYFEEQNSRVTLPARTLPSHVQCLPQPGNFNTNVIFQILDTRYS